MSRRPLQFLALVALAAACSSGDQTAPRTAVSPPSLAIQDGAHAPGNPDFFWLPTLVLPTSSYANWTHNGFNRNLSPTVTVCKLAATTAASINAGTACGPILATIGGADVKKHFPPSADPSDVLTGLPGDWAHYHAKWAVPNNCNNQSFYRIRARVGTTELGFADVQCVTNLLQLLHVDYKKFGAAFKGTQLQIPFRVERYALCSTPGVGPCGTQSIVLTAPSSTPLTDPTTGIVIGSVNIPAQTTPSTTGPVVVNVEGCPDLRNRAVNPLDLPTFGPCIRVTTDPVVTLSNAATVFICTIASTSGGQNVGTVSHAQEHRITMHRRNETPTPNVAALPHVTGCTVAVAAVDRSLKGLFGALTKGRLKDAGGRLLDIVGPQPLHARRIDVGGGGLTLGFSDFQLALPGSAEITGGDGQAGTPGSTLPDAAEVTVRDVGGEPVGGARVRFLASGDGEPTPEIVVATAAGTGIASTPWTLQTAFGANTLVARGFGVGGTDFNGPRVEQVDPFQPIQPPFDAVPALPLPPATPLAYGSVTFNATGVAAGVVLPIEYGSEGWSYQIDGEVPVDWASSAGSPFESTGAAPFGSPNTNCALNNAGFATAWPAGTNTFLFARKTFALGSATTVRIGVAIDNDVQVFVDGVDVSGGLQLHENCPTQDSFVFNVPLSAGSHIIAIRARDRGTSSYLDVQVTILPSE
jgi:hypothetical protein